MRTSFVVLIVICAGCGGAVPGGVTPEEVPEVVPPAPLGVPALTIQRGHAGGLRALAVSPNGRHVASAGDDRTTKVWEVSSGRLLTTLEGHTAPVVAVDFDTDGERLVTASRDGTARIWESATGRLLFTLEGHRVLCSPRASMLLGAAS